MRWCLTAVLFVGLVCTVRSEGDPFLHIMSRSTVYNVGDIKAIFCKGQNLDQPIQWIRPDNQVVGERSSSNNRVFVERKNEDDAIVLALIIHRINLSDGGNWTCSAGTLSETREFIVGEKVVLTERNVSVEGEEGKSVKLTCEAKGTPPPVVVWYKEKQPMKLDSPSRKYFLKKEDNSLEIRKLTHADMGLYTCKVRQKALSHYTEKNIQLSVQHRPILINRKRQAIVKVEEVYALLNETKNVTCMAIANPPPTYKWFKKNGKYETAIADEDTVITADDGSSSVLVLRMYDESSAAEYKCTAINTKGEQSIVFHINLGTKPDPPDVLSLYSADINELTFNVSCSTCVLPVEEEGVTSDSKTILGYDFQLVPKKEGYEADWDIAEEFERDYNKNDTLYTVGPLANKTSFHVRVRTRNSAGASVWAEIPGDIATGNQWRIAAATFVVFAAFVFTRLY